jgi:ParB family chromosome partitioning protein
VKHRENQYEEFTMSNQNQVDLRSIPLSLLRLSPRNVRQASSKGRDRKAGALSIKQLAASIAEFGVVQNLVVTQGDDEFFYVEAGGRRLAALELLKKEKKIEADHELICRVVPESEAVAISLTENVQREAMHPADEFVAFKKLLDEGKSIEDVAAAFGITPLVVQRRLKLANVSPRLQKDFRKDEVSLEQLMALAITDDHAAQEAAFYKAPEYQRSPDKLRERLTVQEIDAGRDVVAKFVGVAAYEAAGGALRRDLFADEGQGLYLCDCELLERLAAEQIQPVVQDVQGEGWSWVSVAVRTQPHDFYSWGRVQPSRRKPTAQEGKKITALKKSQQGLYKQMQALDDDDAEDAYEQLQTEVDKVEEQLQVIEQGLQVYKPEALAVAGAVVTLDSKGTIFVYRGLVREEDAKRARALERQQRKVERAADGDDAGQANADVKTLSDALTRRLSAHRTAALQVELARQPHVALVAVVHGLVLKAFSDTWYGDTAVRVTCTPQTELQRWVPDIDESLAAQAFREERNAWLARLPVDEDGRIDAAKLFAELLVMPDADLLSLMALCAAASANTVTDRESSAIAAPLAKALKLDMASWWKATGDSYFAHVSKARVIEALSEFAPGEVAKAEKMKKGELAAFAERAAEGTNWLPTMLRTPA